MAWVPIAAAGVGSLLGNKGQHQAAQTAADAQQQAIAAQGQQAQQMFEQAKAYDQQQKTELRDKLTQLMANGNPMFKAAQNLHPQVQASPNGGHFGNAFPRGIGGQQQPAPPPQTLFHPQGQSLQNKLGPMGQNGPQGAAAGLAQGGLGAMQQLQNKGQGQGQGKTIPAPGANGVQRQIPPGTMSYNHIINPNPTPWQPLPQQGPLVTPPQPMAAPAPAAAQTPLGRPSVLQTPRGDGF